MKRVFLIVLDSFGAGEAPDAAAFGDEGSNTLLSVALNKNFHAPNLISLGLFDIDGVIPGGVAHPLGAYGRLSELSADKDTTSGHWELAGLVSRNKMPTYPDGFPDEIISAFEAATGRKVLCNKPYSGTKVIEDYGKEHLENGGLIVYTSADSVFQIAAHTDVVPLETLYEYCRAARKILCGKHAVSRVIARPFVGVPGGFTRTGDRRDFALDPPGVTLLDRLKEAGKDVIAVGKITDIFAARGMTESVLTHSNAEGMAAAKRLQSKDFDGLCFVNLVEFDSNYGHRRNADGYAAAISEFDLFLGEFMQGMREDDLLVITADHGCDPNFRGTDHTREYIPVLFYGNCVRPQNLGTRENFGNVGKTVANALGVPFDVDCEGYSL